MREKLKPEAQERMLSMPQARRDETESSDQDDTKIPLQGEGLTINDARSVINFNDLIARFECREFDNVLNSIGYLSESAGSSPKLLNLEAACFLKLSRFEEALYAAERAIEIQPAIASSHFNKASALYGLKRWVEAAESFLDVLTLKPSHAKANLSVAEFYYKNGLFAKAIPYFARAGGQKARSMSLECLWAAGRTGELFRRLQKLTVEDVCDPRLAAIAAFASEQMHRPNPHPFCPEPFNFIHFGNIANHVESPERFLREMISASESVHKIWEMNELTKNGEISDENIFLQSSTTITKLEQVIWAELRMFLSAYSDMQCSFIENWPKESYLKGWTVRLRRNGHHPFHIHAEGWVSGVVYLKVDQTGTSEGAIEFSNTKGNLPLLNDDFHKVTVMPEVGDILLFPASLYHRTLPLVESDDRRVIAFDLRRAD